MGNTILLADKSITIQKIVELTFSDDQYEIKCVNDGQSALDAIPQVKPSIILADISLPVRTGYELCQTLRTDPAFSAYATIPVILLAGIYETMDEDRAKAVEARVKEVGANDLLSKPFDPQLLTTKVHDLIVKSASPAATTEIPVPVADESFFQTNPGIFSESSPTPASTVEPASVSFAEQPADDSEKTMMLPNPFPFASNMFAPEPPPVEDAPVPPPPPAPEPPPLLADPTLSLRADIISPFNEPIFEVTDMPDATPAELLRPDPVREPEPELEQDRTLPDIRGEAFTGREEVEFSFESEPELMTPPVQHTEPIPFVISETELPMEEAPTVHIDAVTPGHDDPFGDVFEEASAAPQWASTSEEDNPFGLPEPPPPPPMPEPVAILEEPMIADAPGADAVLLEEAETVTVRDWTLPPNEAPIPAAAEDQAAIEQMLAVPELRPDFGDDTWSRARASAEGQNVEELFEPAESGADEVEELQPDLSESEIQEPEFIVESAADVTMPVQQTVTGGPVEITDDLIDRIAARVVAKLSEKVVSEIVWQVVPDLAEKMIRRELEKLHAGEE